MKRLVYVLSFLLLTPVLSNAQSFKFVDDKTYASLEWQAESPNDIHADVVNLTAEPLSMSWKLISSTIDSFTICDNEFCLEGTAPGRTSMTKLPPGQVITFLKVSVATYTPKNGKATYLVYATNEGEMSGKEFTFEIKSGAVSVVEEAETSSNFTITPNPISDQMTISGHQGAMISIYDINGSLVFSSQLQSDEEVISTTQLIPGLYSVKMTKGASILFSSFVRQ